MERKKQDPAKCNHRSVHKSHSIDDTSEKRNLRRVDAYLWLRVVVVKVIVGAVVGVVGFVQQLDRQRPAERLRNERVLDRKRGMLELVLRNSSVRRQDKGFAKMTRTEKILCPLCKWFIMQWVSIFKTSLGWVITSNITVLSFWQDCGEKVSRCCPGHVTGSNDKT